jgi:hypothetical protein
MGDRGVDVVLRYEFPAELQRKLGQVRPDLSAGGVERTLESLRLFLAACALTRPRSAAPLAMSSETASLAWRQFILLTQAYRAFCADAFRGPLHHGTRPAGVDARRDLERTQQALAALQRHLDSSGTVTTNVSRVAPATLENLFSTSWDSPGRGTVDVAAVAGVRTGLTSVPVGDAVPPARGLEHRADFIARYEFPPELSAQVAEQHPHLDRDRVAIVLDGLRHYFLMCVVNQSERSRYPVGMPSRVVDYAWHAFIVMTVAYEEFCLGAFGRYLHHTPKALMETPMIVALANTHRRAGDVAALTHGEAAPVAGPSRGFRHRPSRLTLHAALPSLFAIDRVLAVPGGYTYDELTMSHIKARSAEWEHGTGRKRGGGWGGGCGGGGCGGGGCGGGG